MTDQHHSTAVEPDYDPGLLRRAADMDAHAEPAPPQQHLVELDPRRRASLRRLGHPNHTTYLAHTEPDGVIVLIPAVVIPEAQARLLESPVRDQVANASAANAVRGRGRPQRRT